MECMNQILQLTELSAKKLELGIKYEYIVTKY